MHKDKVYDILREKYDRLCWSTAYKISGDNAIASLEDNYQDLWMSIYEAIKGFTKQND